jgi:hypothetical protein
MSATRWVWILLGILAVVGGCAPGTAPSDSPPATVGAVAPSASHRAGEPSAPGFALYGHGLGHARNRSVNGR